MSPLGAPIGAYGTAHHQGMAREASWRGRRRREIEGKRRPAWRNKAPRSGNHAVFLWCARTGVSCAANARARKWY